MTILTDVDILDITPPQMERQHFETFSDINGNEIRIEPLKRLGRIFLTTTRDLRRDLHHGALIEIRCYGFQIRGLVVKVIELCPSGRTTSMTWRVEIQPSGRPNYVTGILRRDRMTFPINWRDDMKVFEAIVVKLDDKGEPELVVKVVAAFVAKTEADARNIVMVDFAQEYKLSGKDLTGYSVRVRTFQNV